ncbi:MAG: FAD-binding protein [Deltaproteobacteria bacterium]|nr:FAD-binding protein [Deltaproteobacteria bacterium]MBW2415369.1 FAD-binding protein [Deltaproteobacteria bacterium]
MKVIRHDIVLVGGGGAGLRAAIAAVEVSPETTVCCVSKLYPMRSHTVSAEGGAAAVAGSDDNLDLHAYDTLKGSDFLADQDAVEQFVQEAPGELTQLEHWGCPWSREPDGRVAVRAFGGMSVKRTWFAADKTGFHMLHALFQTSMKYDRIVRLDEFFATKLLVDNGRVCGVAALDIRTGEVTAVLGRAVILCTGGAGQVFPFTTNAAVKTGDGMALAYREGVPLKDMEFVQYHPTGLPGTGILITEASRGEGGHLYNNEGERFLVTHDYGVGNKAELGPRDMLSRAIMREMEAGRAFDGSYGKYVHLDLRHLGEKKIDEKLPFVRELARNFVGVDPVHEPIPVRPVVHYMMGGVDTDITGATPMPGLYAAGEVAAVSINGANRLGSNSLTECLVFGRRAGEAAVRFAGDCADGDERVLVDQAEAEHGRMDALRNKVGGEQIAVIRREMQASMESGCGVFRDQGSMDATVAALRQLKGRYADIGLSDRSKVFNTEIVQAMELRNMLDVAEAVAQTAAVRTESRGAHTRTDYPTRDDSQFLKHSLVNFSPQGPEIGYRDVTLTRWTPEERKY